MVNVLTAPPVIGSPNTVPKSAAHGMPPTPIKVEASLQLTSSTTTAPLPATSTFLHRRESDSSVLSTTEEGGSRRSSGASSFLNDGSSSAASSSNLCCVFEEVDTEQVRFGDLSLTSPAPVATMGGGGGVMDMDIYMMNMNIQMQLQMHKDAATAAATTDPTLPPQQQRQALPLPHSILRSHSFESLVTSGSLTAGPMAHQNSPRVRHAPMARRASAAALHPIVVPTLSVPVSGPMQASQDPQQQQQQQPSQYQHPMTPYPRMTRRKSNHISSTPTVAGRVDLPHLNTEFTSTKPSMRRSSFVGSETYAMGRRGSAVSAGVGTTPTLNRSHSQFNINTYGIPNHGPATPPTSNMATAYHPYNGYRQGRKRSLDHGTILHQAAPKSSGETYTQYPAQMYLPMSAGPMHHPGAMTMLQRRFSVPFMPDMSALPGTQQHLHLQMYYPEEVTSAPLYHQLTAPYIHDGMHTPLISLSSPFDDASTPTPPPNSALSTICTPTPTGGMYNMDTNSGYLGSPALASAADGPFDPSSVFAVPSPLPIEKWDMISTGVLSAASYEDHHHHNALGLDSATSTALFSPDKMLTDGWGDGYCWNITSATTSATISAGGVTADDHGGAACPPLLYESGEEVGATRGDGYYYGEEEEDEDYARARHDAMGKETHTCDANGCGMTFDTETSFNAHVKMHAPPATRQQQQVDRRSHVCEVCQRAFVRRQDLKRHSATHSATFKPFNCYNCATTFTRSDALHRHIKARRCL
ncbi:uncharacterized protein EV422DRAFT_124067 [Fimicolochytrium jonesii]|uniref:uncharacterized protein n=1 Tax=Fimicolochytrium jonesii TaxID=1396493 RepID=UPI0022FE6C80|nr:uncharacterized protein EV422DRAFT_124067 [Fimicolochytrium jonesii]KAI8818888.1 hypothetical protein EV422DRAFT_124067 [Fimicolochytrium jonesii]